MDQGELIRRTAYAAAAILLTAVTGCSTTPEPPAALPKPWTELCDVHCSTLESLTDESTQKCGRPAGPEQADCLTRIVTEISAIERNLPTPDTAGITNDIDTIFTTSEKYSENQCGSGRVRGSLPAATCTIQSITIETSARCVLTKMQTAVES